MKIDTKFHIFMITLISFLVVGFVVFVVAASHVLSSVILYFQQYLEAMSRCTY